MKPFLKCYSLLLTMGMLPDLREEHTMMSIRDK